MITPVIVGKSEKVCLKTSTENIFPLLEKSKTVSCAFYVSFDPKWVKFTGIPIGIKIY